MLLILLMVVWGQAFLRVGFLRGKSGRRNQTALVLDGVGSVLLIHRLNGLLIFQADAQISRWIRCHISRRLRLILLLSTCLNAPFEWWLDDLALGNNQCLWIWPLDLVWSFCPHVSACALLHIGVGILRSFLLGLIGVLHILRWELSALVWVRRVSGERCMLRMRKGRLLLLVATSL